MRKNNKRDSEKSPPFKTEVILGWPSSSTCRVTLILFDFLFLHPENHRTEALKPLSKSQKAYHSHDGYA